MVYYSMDNLRGRLGSTRHERGLGCNADSSSFVVGCRANKGNAAVFCFTGYRHPLLRNRIKAEPSFFGGGEDPHENARASKAGGLMKLRHPTSNLFYEKTTTNSTIT